MQILDYSGGYPGAAAIRRAGYGGVIRYLRKEGTSRVQPITGAELADMRAHGLAVALVYQAIRTERILGGRAAGAHDARWAQARAAELGAPDAVIYFAADRDIVGTAQLATVLAYLDGAAGVLGKSRVGVYGEYDVIEAAVPAHATYGWQTAAWSGGRRSKRAHLYQRTGQPLVGGIPVDINDVLQQDWGQLDQEDDMPSLDELLSTKLGKDGNTAFDKWADQPGTLGHWLRGQRQYAAGTRSIVTAQAATIDKLTDLLAANNPDLTAAEVKAAVAAALAEGTVKVDVDLTVGGKAVDQ